MKVNVKRRKNSMKEQKPLSKTSKAVISLLAAVALICAVFAGCSVAKNNDDSTSESGAQSSAMSGTISPISREDGSGTRGAFIELFGIEEKDASGNKVDKTVETSEITNSTSVMMTTVAGNKQAIGYVSLGSLSDDVKALKVDGVEATTDNVKSGTYKIARPFNVVTKDKISDSAEDFMNFILSDEGQKVVTDNGYVSQSSTGAFKSNGATGKVTVAGSSSVTPVMEKLKEAYAKVNSGVTIEVQQNDSTTGVTSAIDGTCDIGMASRELKDTETSKGVKATVIAMDGIAVIVNNENPISDITSDSVKGIYTGTITDWSEVK